MGVLKPVVTAFLAVNLLLLAACLFALRQNKTLRAQAANYVALLTPPNGSVLPPLLGTDLKGASQAIAYGQDQRSTLIYTFSKGCEYCKENWRAMHSLQTLAPGRLRIVYVDTLLDVFTPKYLADNGIERSALLVQLSPASEFLYAARLVPQAVLVDHEGRVRWSHVGELDRADVSKALSLIKGN